MRYNSTSEANNIYEKGRMRGVERNSFDVDAANGFHPQCITNTTTFSQLSLWCYLHHNFLRNSKFCRSSIPRNSKPNKKSVDGRSMTKQDFTQLP